MQNLIEQLEQTGTELDAELARLAQTLARGEAFIRAMNGDRHESN